MIPLALIGKNILHSKSPQIYRELSEEEVNYKIFDCVGEKDIPTLEKIFQEFVGLSITSPYKKFFLPKVKVLPGFEELNAINAIRKRKGIFEAINTDFQAIEKIIENYEGFNVIVLGDGVMSSITQKVLKKKYFNFKVFSRKKNGLIDKLILTNVFLSGDRPLLIINACSRDFIFQGELPPNSVFWDFNYGIKEHEKLFPTKKVKYIDGMSLLKLQAKFALEFFRF